jgi:Na+/H+ antiporter NhaA
MKPSSSPNISGIQMHASSLRPPSALRALINDEASGGLVLMEAAAVAMGVADSPLSDA